MRYLKPCVFELNRIVRSSGIDPWSCVTGNGASGQNVCLTGNGAKDNCFTGNSAPVKTSSCIPGTTIAGSDCFSGVNATPHMCEAGSVGANDTTGCNIGNSFS